VLNQLKLTGEAQSATTATEDSLQQRVEGSDHEITKV
jgi:hypothetical protein